MKSSIPPDQLQIVNYPHPMLRQVGSEIDEISDDVRAVARRMIDLMHEAEGVGLAAEQVALPWRLFVASVPGQTDGDQVYINPVLRDPAGKPESQEEGCLSLPGIRGQILRPPAITIEATNLDGERFQVEADELLARCWQHEVDHLNGRLIIDRMPQIDRLSNRRRIKELEEEYRFLQQATG